MSLVQKNNKKISFGENADLNKVLSEITPKTKLLQIHIAENIHNELRAACFQRGESMKNVVSNLIEKWLREEKL
ncbi:plasmid partition protein ParG [Testudinibacter sp. TR-2022]|uniref:plasmid partition protein ParG n=1 Tax=Testudinibacter sp. TR-2022 TaxID=2585029 RepID=UPI00159BB626|nr:plasmid partition protein ParG [Testudinibacter sp. TR-2022]